jgi:hypothetical protein
MLIAIVTIIAPARTILSSLVPSRIIRVRPSSIITSGAARGTRDHTARILGIARIQPSLFQQLVLALDFRLLVGTIASTGGLGGF